MKHLRILALSFSVCCASLVAFASTAAAAFNNLAPIEEISFVAAYQLDTGSGQSVNVVADNSQINRLPGKNMLATKLSSSCGNCHRKLPERTKFAKPDNVAFKLPEFVSRNDVRTFMPLVRQ